MGYGNKTLKDYVSTTDQQSQSVQGLMRASEEARDQQIAQNNAIIQGTAAAKASQAAMKGLALAGNILAPMLIGSAISQIAGWIDDIVHRSDKIIAKANEARQAVLNISDSLDSARSLASESPESYSALFSGVDPLTNKNSSLSTEEYEQYLDICSQLADTFPELIKGHDAENNAILTLGNNAKDAAAKLQELYKQKQMAAKLEIAAQLPDLYAGYLEEIKKLDGEKKKLEDSINAYHSGTSTNSGGIAFSKGRFSVSSELPDADAILDEIYALLTEHGVDLSTVTLDKRENENGVMTSYLEGFLLTDQQLKELQADMPKFRERLLSSYEDEITLMEKQKLELDNKKKAAWQSTVPAILSSLSASDGYANLTEKAQAAVSQIITGLDMSRLPADSHVRDIKDFIYTSFIMPLSDPKTKDEVSRLYAQLAAIDTRQITEENKKKLDQTLAALSEYTQVDRQRLHDSLKLDDFDTLYQNKEALYDKARDTAMEQASLDGSYDQTGYTLFTGVLDGINTQDEIAALGKCMEETNSLTRAVIKYSKAKQDASDIDLSPSSMAKNLSDMEHTMEKISSLYQEFQESGRKGISKDSLSGLTETFAEMEGIDMDDFLSSLYDSASTSEDVEAAFQSLASQYLDATGILNSLTEENKDLAAAQLESMGFSNASELVNRRLADSVNGLSVSEELLNYEYLALSAASADINAQNSCTSEAFLQQAAMSDYAKTALAQLVAQQQVFSNDTLNTEEKIQALYDITQAYFGAAAAVTFYNDVKKNAESSNPDSLIELWQQTVDKNGKKDKPDLDPQNIRPKTPPSMPKRSSGSSAAKAPTPQTYDWVEKKLASIATLTERAGKAFEKAFSFGSTQKKFKEYLSAIDADLAANRTAADTYQTKMNSLGLAPAWIDKIKSGAYAIEDVTNETLKKQISDYETYYGKWKKCDEALLALEEKRAQAQKSRADKTISFQEKELRKTQTQISRKKALADLKESFGLSASGKDYAFQQKKSAAQLSTLKKHNAYLKTLQKTVAKGSDAWNAYQEQTEKNTEKSRELTQAIADLAAKAAGLPTEKLDKFLEKNNQKQELYEAKAASSVGNNKNNWIKKQISLTKAKNRKTAGTAEQTKKNLRTAGFKDLRAAQNADQKGRSKSGKARVKTYYADMRKYVKKKKAIPAEFIQKLINAGFHQMARAAANYNAALAANETARAAADLCAETSKKETAELVLKQFQNTQSSYEQEQHKGSSRLEYFSSAISLAESQGRLADHNYYQTRLLLEQGNQKSLAEERRTLQSMLNRAVARGNIREFSDEWLEMADSIYQVDQALAQSKETLAEYQNQLQQIKFDHFEYLQEQISRLTQEADFYIGVLGAKPLTDDAGLTEQGIATMGLHYQKSEIYQNQAAQYAKEIERLNRELLKDPVNTTWISQLENYQDMQKECIQNAQNEKQAIAELVTQGYQALIDSLDKSVSKYKELLQNAKNAHEYQKNIAQQTDQISTLKKQINAYASMTESEETSAKLQQLMNNLEQAQSSLDETMYDKYLSDTQNAMDEMVNDLEDFLSELSEHSDQLIQEGIDMVKGSADAISTTMTDLSKEYGSTLSAAMSASWGNYGSAAGGVDAVINSFRELMAATGQKNDEQAYQDASAIYTNYRSFDQRIANAKSDQNTLKEQRDKAKKEKEQAKKNLDKVKKKNGKNSKQYKAAEQKYHTANKNYEEAEKKFKNSKQKVENLKAQQEAAKTSGKTTVQNFLTAIADAGPSKPSASMDALDNAVLQITGGYINDANRRQILSLLGANDAGQAAAILKELGFAVPAADGGRLVSVGDNSFQKEAAKDTSKNKKTPSQTKKDTSKNKKNTSKNKKKKPSKNNTASGKLKDTAPKTMAKSSSYQRLSSQSDNGYHKNDSAPFQPQNLFSQTRSGFLPDLLTPENMIKDDIPSGFLEPGSLTITTGDLLLPDVTDPSEFASGMVNALKNDPTVQKTLGSLVNSSLTRGNSLITQKY